MKIKNWFIWKIGREQSFTKTDRITNSNEFIRISLDWKINHFSFVANTPLRLVEKYILPCLNNDFILNRNEVLTNSNEPNNNEFNIYL